MNSPFSSGQIVRLRANLGRSGAVLAALPSVGGEPRYQVFHGPGDVREYIHSQLVADVPREKDELAELIEGDAPSDADTFRARLTASRLAHPQTDNLYALYAARIKQIPFQYKPLLRLLRADRPRLLIADEVGVGKTIEAGLILKELQARQRLDNVLIVCPKALVTKWRAEMRRFDEDFQILNSERLRHCLRETHLDGAWPIQHARSIVPLEVIRKEEYLSGVPGRAKRYGLLELDPPPRFDLLIVDEAHHVRNPETHSHEVVRYLADESEAAVFLSATPVHIGSRNLFALLNLLRPDLFPDMAVFEEMVEPNRHITQAMRHLRAQGDGWAESAADALAAAAGTPWGSVALAADTRFTAWAPILAAGQPLPDRERVRCLRDLEEVHTLAHVMNRTRRRDIGRFTIRDPRTLSVAFTAEQQIFYDALLEFRRQLLSLRYDARVVRLITDTLERQAASSLPALVPLLERVMSVGQFSIGSVTDADEDGADLDDEPMALPPGLLDAADRLRALAAALPPDDPKLERLRQVVQETMLPDGPGKLLLFSFFLHTLAYLERALRSVGVRVGVITGKVPDEDREALRDRFRLPRANPNAIDLLLSSEVGCEGLDYEFCDRLVNYDIPWNPMRIEQRIGRIDRFGQTAEKVLIFNFITPGTVEERIYFRCFERLGLFRDTVGDLEEVLGDIVGDLNRVALDPTLTPQQADERARQTADNALRLLEEQGRLEDERSGLLGIDEAFTEEVDTLRSEGRFVAPDDLRTMVAAYLARPGIDGRLGPDESNPRVDRIRLRRESRAEIAKDVRALKRMDRLTVELIRWLDGEDQYLAVTFDQAIALERRDLPFVTPVHPLAKAAVAYWESQDEPLTARLAAVDPDVAPGSYLFSCDLWETIAATPAVRLVVTAYHMESRRIAPQIGRVFSRLLERAAPAAAPAGLVASLDGPVQAIDEEIYRRRDVELSTLRSSNDALIARKLASVDAHHRNRLERINRELEFTADERIVRMRTAGKARIEQDYQEARDTIELRRDADIVTKRLALGLLEVGHAE